MKFNIMGFNQDLLINKYSNLNGNDVIVLRVLVDILPRMTRTITVDGKEFKQVTYELLLEDIPFITQSASTLKKIVRKLINAGLIERYVLNKGGKFTYFRVTKNLEELIFKEEEKAPEKPKKKKKDIKKTNVDSNGNEPIEGQMNDIEALEIIEDERVKLVNEKITTGIASEKLINIVTSKPIEEVKEVLNNINGDFVTSLFIENAFNKVKLVKNNTSYSYAQKEVNGLGFNNFKPREYDYDELEKKLLGWE